MNPRSPSIAAYPRTILMGDKSGTRGLAFRHAIVASPGFVPFHDQILGLNKKVRYCAFSKTVQIDPKP